jgi:molybdate transport system ATP-binding protein
VIELDVTLPLPLFRLRVTASLPADTVAVLGPSGSGKTSLLEAIAGLRPRAAGRISVRGQVVMDTASGVFLPPEKRRVGYVPQDSCLFPHLDVAGNVRFGMRPGNGAAALFDEVVGILEIAPLLGRFPSAISGGERQRVALARAIATEPRLLLLDEPLAAVDPALKGRILPYLLRVRDRLQIPFLYVTHNAGEARAVASEAIVLREGAVMFAGAPDEALRSMSLVDPEARFDNILSGTFGKARGVRETASLQVGAALFNVPADESARPGALAVFSVAPDDVLVSTRPLEGISARNVHPGKVISCEISGATAWPRIAAAGLEWTARLTRTSAEELGLKPGLDVWIAVKSHAFRRLS